MPDFYYNSLFAEGDPVAVQMFRNSFWAMRTEIDPHTFYCERVGQCRTLMYSYRTSSASSVASTHWIANSWPKVSLTFIYDALGELAEHGFTVYREGNCILFGGTPVGLDAVATAEGYPSRERYGLHRLSRQVFERRMRVCGVMPDDAWDDGQHRDDDPRDWF